MSGILPVFALEGKSPMDPIRPTVLGGSKPRPADFYGLSGLGGPFFQGHRGGASSNVNRTTPPNTQ